MNIKDLQKPLSIEQIEFRIQSINKGWYATILAYKDARVDMNVLDNIAWAFNWKKQYTRDNKNCIVSIYDESKKEWISKEDTWTESNTEQAKGLASDSFKRACFNWGIWRELYDYPVIQVKLNSNEFEIWSNWKAKATWWLQLKKWIWVSEFKDWKVLWLACKDEDWKVRFKYWVFTKK